MEQRLGIFKTAQEAIAAAKKAQQALVKDFTLADRDRFAEAIKQAVLARIEEFSKKEFTETGYGRYEDKLMKNTGTVTDTQGTEAIPRNIIATDKGLTVEYFAPFGIIGAVTPVTNPIATIVSNSLYMMIAGNAVVFNPHPSSKACSLDAVECINQAMQQAGGPVNIAVTVEEPTLATLDDITGSPDVKLMVGTGGPAMVAALMKSGKKVVAAGPGNPPCIVDETADIKQAAAGILGSASFENNLLCVAEKEIFCVDSVFDELMKEMQALGAVMLNREQADAVTAAAIIQTPAGEYVPNKKFVGKMSADILAAAGIKVEGDPRLAIFEAQNDDLFVQTEQMMPILPIVRCKNFEEALQWAVAAEHDNKHSASIWSQSIDHVTAYGTVINTTVFVQNGGTMAAFGMGGSGTNSPTIATPTGEGITGPQTYTRKRRFAMAGGGNYLL